MVISYFWTIRTFEVIFVLVVEGGQIWHILVWWYFFLIPRVLVSTFRITTIVNLYLSKGNYKAKWFLLTWSSGQSQSSSCHVRLFVWVLSTQFFSRHLIDLRSYDQFRDLSLVNPRSLSLMVFHHISPFSPFFTVSHLLKKSINLQ